MRIRIGYDIAFASATPTPTILMLSVHSSRLDDLTKPHRITFDPPIPSHTYTDHFGNICTRIVMPPGILTASSGNVVCDSGLPDAVEPDAEQTPVENLPDESFEFLLGSRHCETDRLSDTAWSLFGRVSPGWARVQAICNYVRDRSNYFSPFRHRVRNRRHANITEIAGAVVIGRGSFQHPMLARPPAQVEIGWPRDAQMIVTSWVMDHLTIR